MKIYGIVPMFFVLKCRIGGSIEYETILQNAFSPMTFGVRCIGVEAELPAVYSFGNSGQHSTRRPQGEVGLKAFCKSNEVVE